MKKCSHCKQGEPEVEFYSRSSGYCRDCHKAYLRQHRKNKRAMQYVYQRNSGSAAWMEKHDEKTCTVCGLKGSSTPETWFRSLAFERCNECMTNGWHRCSRCGLKKHTNAMASNGSFCKACDSGRTKRNRVLRRERVINRPIPFVVGRVCGNCGEVLRKLPTGYRDLENHECK